MSSFSTCVPTVTRTTCPYCGVGCGVEITSSPQGVSVKGDKEHPANIGQLCSKGYALAKTLGYENRLLGPKIDNKEVSWSDALSHVSDEFKRVRETYGPEAIAFYVSGQLLTEDYYVVNKLVKGYLGTGNIDTNSRLCMASSVAGYKRAFGSDTVPGCYEDLELADLLVLVGSNLAWCHPVLFRRIEAARETNPALKVVVIDPRFTATAQMADLHLPIAPGGENDIALFVGLLNNLSTTDSLDQSWISGHTVQFDDVRKASTPWTIKQVAYRTGLAEVDVAEFYRLFRSTKKVVTVFSQGVNQSSCGTDTVNSIINVHLATGRIGKPGCGPFSITGQPNAMGGREVGGLANTLACHMDIENAQHRDLVQRFWSAPTMVAKPGLKAVDLFDAVKAGQIKALWVMATNPADSMPAANEVAQAIAECPFVVVSEVSSSTDTLNLAHVQLPAQAWSEKDGTVTNSERRISRQRAFRTAPAEAKPDWWAVCEVAKRMGYADGFGFRSASEIFAEHAALSGFENEGSRDFDISACANITVDKYDALTPFQWPMSAASFKQDDKASARMFTDGQFFTADRKAKFINVNIPDTGAARAERVLGSKKASRKNPSILLNTGRSRDQWHTMTRTGYIDSLSSHIGEPYVELNPADAEQLGLQEATVVDLSNKQGRITVRLLISEQVLPGTAFSPMHWSDVFSANARVNVLSSKKTDPISGQPGLKYQRVRVTASPVLSYGVMVSRLKPKSLGFLHYWAITPVSNGWKIEFASQHKPEQLMHDFVARSKLSMIQYQVVTSRTSDGSQFNTCWFDGHELMQAVYVADCPVWAPRETICGFLSESFSSAQERLAALSGAGRQGQPKKGTIVCSCMSVGRAEIERTINDGAVTVELVGNSCMAGTQCGSCQPEIKALLKKTIKPISTGEDELPKVCA